MNSNFGSFLVTVVSIGIAFVIPVATLMFVRAKTRAPAPLPPADLSVSERQDLADLRSRMLEFDEMQRRLGELEERVDFAERLLTRKEESGRLGDGH
ncbi:MAG: hypothetical protein ABJD11_08840 [Gemmatimonadota bacterium]